MLSKVRVGWSSPPFITSPHQCSVYHFNQLLCFPVGLPRRRKVKRSGNTVLHLQRHHQVQCQTVHATERSAKESTDIRNMNLRDQQIHHPAPVTRGKRWRRRRKSTIVSRPKKTRNTRKKEEDKILLITFIKHGITISTTKVKTYCYYFKLQLIILLNLFSDEIIKLGLFVSMSKHELLLGLCHDESTIWSLYAWWT